MWAGSSAWHERLTCTRRSPETASRLSSNINEMLEDFTEFLLVDMRRSEKTAYEAARFVRKFMESLNGNRVSQDDVRQYLKQIKGEATYRNTLASLKRFFRDFLQLPQIVETFRFPPTQFKPKMIPKKAELHEFYKAIDSDVGKALFLFYATSGLRKNEVLTLTREDIDFSKRMVIPNCHNGQTKHSYVSFYNEETENLLKEIVPGEDEKTNKLFSISDREYRKIWKNARVKTGLKITPQRLREWFCSEMALKGVSDSYIDAFCGRTPRSVLARHYLDYSPEKLKEIYDKANLKVLAFSKNRNPENPPFFKLEI